MEINPHVPYISKAKLEMQAKTLLRRYAREIEPIDSPPIPVEEIADFLLQLDLEWLEIPDTDEAPVLAYLHARSKTIRLNERRLAFFEQYPGTYEYTLAHEIGHYHLHLTAHSAQIDHVYIYRHKQTVQDRREWQAERFAGYLLLPESLLLPAIAGINLLRWPELYRLRDCFKVSITALRIRLEELGYLHVAPNGRLYPSQAASTGDRRKDGRRLVGRGQFYLSLGQVDQAIAAYRQALTIAQELGNRRDEAFLSWQLGLLYAETDPVQAVALMSICVAYEQNVGHPQAKADAEHLARLKARL